ncbi:hypothetical protein FRB96_001531 [Tulasnella sp. 330]|nr:hypothetical protein FRB96_001531 [Tulasnella sp. 330]
MASQPSSLSRTLHATLLERMSHTLQFKSPTKRKQGDLIVLIRLHVNIQDSTRRHFTVPSFIIPSKSLASTASSSALSSDLVFNYSGTPFAFWITRRSDPHGTPLFDTRLSSLPAVPVPEIVPGDATTEFKGFQLVFENQYLQLTSSLPYDANIYGLGEVIASSGIRRNMLGKGSIQTMWARDINDPVDENEYGMHPMYIEHRYNNSTGGSASHGVFLNRPVQSRLSLDLDSNAGSLGSAAGSDVMLFTPPNSPRSFIQYRQIGGTLDLFFYSGSTPQAVIEQHSEVVGKPAWIPAWGLGFHLCRWGYANISETKEQVTKMREANIPLEVMWNDIDVYHSYRDFTLDPVSFAASEMKAFLAELAANHQHFIPIVDAAIPVLTNTTDVLDPVPKYDPYTRGQEQQVFIRNPDGSEYIGQVWPGYTAFPDWFAEKTISWWTEALRNWTTMGMTFSGALSVMAIIIVFKDSYLADKGIWLDMNEVSSFCEGSWHASSYTGVNLSNTSTPFILPGEPGGLITTYPECYNATIYGPSGNHTIKGALTCDQSALSSLKQESQAGGLVELATFEMHERRSKQSYDYNLKVMAFELWYAGFGKLSANAVATNATHAGGIVELDAHNLFGTMEEHATYEALLRIYPGKRPFIISRSTFAGAGKWTGHWTGDNFATWESMRYSIQGILQFQIFQIPMVGADTCGFGGNTGEELCNRWMQLSAFAPFYRNHNIRGAIPQEPYRWDSVAQASRTAINIRYTLLPYWYTLFANASLYGSPVVRALFFEFPDEPELFNVDQQFMIGSDILVTPVLEPNADSVRGYFPGSGKVTWRDWYTHDAVKSSPGTLNTLPAPLGHINVHIRGGSAILCSTDPAYTIEDTRQGSYSFIVSLASNGGAFGTAYIDDGESYPPGQNRTLTFLATNGKVIVKSNGDYTVNQRLEIVTLLGITHKPSVMKVNGTPVGGWTYSVGQEKVVLSNAGWDLNEATTTLSWS